jgi:hypothetical protein
MKRCLSSEFHFPDLGRAVTLSSAKRWGEREVEGESSKDFKLSELSEDFEDKAIRAVNVRRSERGRVMRFDASGSIFGDFEDVVSTSMELPCVLSNASGKVFILGTRTLARPYSCLLRARVLKASISEIQ